MRQLRDEPLQQDTCALNRPLLAECRDGDGGWIAKVRQVYLCLLAFISNIAHGVAKHVSVQPLGCEEQKEREK